MERSFHRRRISEGRPRRAKGRTSYPPRLRGLFCEAPPGLRSRSSRCRRSSRSPRRPRARRSGADLAGRSIPGSRVDLGARDRPEDRQGRLLAPRRPALRPASNEKLAVALGALAGSGLSTASARASSAWDGGTEGLARAARAQGLRRPDAEPVRPEAARARDPARGSGRSRGASSRTRSTSTRSGWGRAGSPRSTRASRRRSRRSSFRAASVNGHTVTTPRSCRAAHSDTALERAGCNAVRRVAGDGQGNRARLADIYSPQIVTMVRVMNKRSDNFFAEMLLKQIGALHGRAGRARPGAASCGACCKRAACLSPAFGSGRLGTLPATTAARRGRSRRSCLGVGRHRDLRDLLCVASDRRDQRDARRPDGTGARARARAREDGHDPGRVGALRLRRRRSYVFSVLQNGSPVSSTRARASQDRVGQILAGAAG